MTKPTPFFSIVVPTWNTGAKIDETIHSLLNQEFPRDQYEIVIVDDGSTDKTLDRLKPYSDRIQILQQQNSGAASARNRGMQHAKGEYIVCFDHDDILLPHALAIYKRVVDAFERPPVLLAAYSSFSAAKALKIPFANPSIVECVKFRDYFGKTVSTPKSNSVIVLCKERVLSAGGYSQNAGSFDDDDILFKLGDAGPMIKIIRPITVGHRAHGQNASRDLEFCIQGTLALIRNERRGVYPGGGRRMIDRRGLMGSIVIWYCYSYLRRRKESLYARFAGIVRLLLHARGMIFVAFLRKVVGKSYLREPRSIDFSSAESSYPPGIAGRVRGSVAIDMSRDNAH